MPAEWHRHAATLMHWPSNRETWPGDRLDIVEPVFLQIIETISRYEPVILLCAPAAIQKAQKLIADRKIIQNRIHFIEIAVNDVWARDCGPICIYREVDEVIEYAMTDWEYNSWGGKYPPFEDDNQIPSFLAEKYQIPIYQTGIVLEGGSIETNGRGLLLTTESVLLNSNRNPGLDKPEIESFLADYLGIEKVIWLKAGLAGDDTDGHIDDLCRFINEDTVFTSIVNDTGNVNYQVLQHNLTLLRTATDQDGRPLNVVEIPLPETKIEGTTVDGSEYVPASYANFYIANGLVLVPLYDHQFDNDILELFKSYFPDRDVIGIDCSDLVWGQGSIHCVTQQLYGVTL